MVSIGNNILILFAISSLIAFAFPFFKDGVFKQLNVKALLPGILPFVAVLVPFSGIFAAAGYLSIPVGQTLPEFLGAAILAWLLSKTGFPPRLRGVLLLVASVMLSANTPADNGVFTLSAALLGFVVFKIADHILLAAEVTLDDILPAVFWLGGVLAINASDTPLGVSRCKEILLGVISVAQLLRVVQGPFVSDDKVLLKRLVLATTGGLAALLVINKLMLAVDLDKLALLVGGGFFATYLFQNMDAEGTDKVSGISAINLLFVIGMLTLVATRFWGIYGLVLLAPTVLIAPRSGLAQFGGIFFATRALLQVFLATYNSNVTGINLTHAYTGAALYAGFIIAAALLMVMREISDRRLLTIAYLGAGFFVPLAANYYLHAEPTSSLLVAVTVAATIFGILGPALQKGALVGYENLILMPAMMIAVGTTFGGLIEAGNSATTQVRATILAYLAGILLLCIVIGWFVFKSAGKKNRPAQEMP